MSREEDAYVIERMGKLLAEIAIVVNGPEPPLTRWSYHDLPEKVRALKQAQQPAAAVPTGYALVPESYLSDVSDMVSWLQVWRRASLEVGKLAADASDAIDAMLAAAPAPNKEANRG